MTATQRRMTHVSVDDSLRPRHALCNLVAQALRRSLVAFGRAQLRERQREERHLLVRSLARAAKKG